ncbi:3-oxoacyl-reductase [Saitoella complicata NRRL Y-17804]|uniref:Short-chain dehydrogenase n=1 Tax=Saitoella complicata (strain BCRC 22490 / CBS 7301 / JCM 7358 / NBRC 10748 / NRRL Y-17804) TaxID=698492 RepID=A0A0E9NHQ9_SAICN|nr:3-oxoacyl-reductase [Saitoella complicata NRRL Y-17804]ODQ56051.1 3-oxoacyl-reductase [Saitoella complicata NRRL Y-17804]GAO49397.1 hypothetical protein G7K_3547-t1 [Saitoella complicata NRRL Y-17804]
MVGRLQDKVCIVTGAAGGIGIETSILMAREGAFVVMSDISETAVQKAAARVLELNPEAKGRVLPFVCDVSKEAQVKAMVDKAESEWGRPLNVMFNNAGIMHPEDDNALNTEEKIWDLTHSINVKGVWWGCKYAIEAMLRSGKGGSIINTASMVALVGAATPQLAYTASKGAVLAMTRELGIVHAKQGIRINALCPGPLNTPLLQEFLDTQEKRIRRTIHLPMGRFGEAVEQAHAVIFLASDESSYVTAQEFLVDGGLTSAYVTAEGDPAPAPKNNA